jgi:outer membrane protein
MGGKVLSYLIFFARLGVAITIGIVVYPAEAFTLSEAIVLGRQTDPIFLSAQANWAAAQERVSQAYANVLPQISVSANTTTNRRNYETRNVIPTTKDRYNSNNAQLSLTQPVWRSAYWIAGSQANASAAQAEYQYRSAEQDLLVRLAQAWFDVMLARDIYIYAGAQVEAAQFQWEQTKRAAELNLVAGPTLEEARAKYDQALADYSGAGSDQEIKSASLEQIIGPFKSFVPPSLPGEYVIDDPRSGSLEQWLNHAEMNSPMILASLCALEAANEEIRKQRAGHYPTLDIVATYGRNAQTVGSFPGQNGYDIKQKAIGFQLNIPLFSGGGQNAKVAEAVALHEKALQDMESAKRNVRLGAKQAWFGWQAGNARQTAALQAMKFSLLSLASATAGIEKDVKVEIDVLQARQQLYGALRDLQKSRYDMTINHFKLKATAGELQDGDLAAFDVWFAKNKGEADPGISRQPDGIGQTQ